MEKQLNRPVKQLMDEVPQVTTVLNDFGIACAECKGADCLLKDIVEIHQLSDDQQVDLMYRLEKAIYPDRDVKKPEFKPSSGNGQKKKEIKYSPPMQRLVDEHANIKKLASVLPDLTRKVDITTQDGKQLILNAVDFIRSYADKYHHAKEEEILFQYFDESLDIIKVIRNDHTIARGYVKDTLDAIDKGNKNTVVEKLSAYSELLTEHIRKEDEVLYPWMDRNLTTHQIGELFAKFSAVACDFGDGFPYKYENIVLNIEKYLKEQV